MTVCSALLTRKRSHNKLHSRPCLILGGIRDFVFSHIIHLGTWEREYVGAPEVRVQIHPNAQSESRRCPQGQPTAPESIAT